jgi:hypothetical protein
LWNSVTWIARIVLGIEGVAILGGICSSLLLLLLLAMVCCYWQCGSLG